MQRNQLGQAQSHRLCTWIENNRDAARTDDLKALTERAAEALAFPLTVNNMSGAIKNVGIIRPARGKKTETIEQGSIQQLAIAIQHIASFLVLDLPNHAAIAAIAGAEQPELLLTERN